MSAVEEATGHLHDAATWTAKAMVKHLENDHGAVADWDAPWQHHRQAHWRDALALAATQDVAGR